MTIIMKKLLSPVVLAILLTGVSRANAGVFWNNWWGVDGYTTWSYTINSVTVPTGYWGGLYGYNWGGYYWPANYGWWNPPSAIYVSPYVTRYGLDGWGNWAPFYGFTDWYSYTYLSLTPRTIYLVVLLRSSQRHGRRLGCTHDG